VINFSNVSSTNEKFPTVMLCKKIEIDFFFAKAEEEATNVWI